MSFGNSIKHFTFDEHSNSISAPSQIRTRWAKFWTDYISIKFYMHSNNARLLIFLTVIIALIIFVWLKYFYIINMPYSARHFNGTKYIDIRNNKTLNGRYKFSDVNDPNIDFEIYNNGVPVGNWKNYCYGDLQACGKKVIDNTLYSEIIKLTNSKDVFFDSWCEGGADCTDFFRIDLVRPTKYDSNVTLKIITNFKNEIQSKYHSKYISINRLTMDSIQELYRE